MRLGRRAASLVALAAIAGGAPGCFDFSRFHPTGELGLVDGSFDLFGADLTAGPTEIAGSFTADPTTALVTPRFAFATVQTSSAVFVLGGFDAGSQALATVERAELSTATLGPFAIVGVMTHARGDLAAVQVGSSICAIGGTTMRQTPNVATATIECASLGPDDTLGTFNPAGQMLVAPRWAHSAVVANSTVYVLGGRNQANADSPIVETAPIVDGRLGAFAQATVFGNQVVTADLCAFAAQGTLFAVSGYTGSGGDGPFSMHATLVPATMFYDNPWTPATPRDGAGCLLLGKRFYLLGGDYGGKSLAGIEAALVMGPNLVMDATPFAQLSTAREEFGLAAAGQGVYVFGGMVSGGIALASVERAPLQ
jgi:hypothetical protein